MNRETYDYRDRETLSDNVLSEVEDMNERQRTAAYSAIQKVKEDFRENEIQTHEEWFDKALFPLFQEYAKETFSQLIIEKGEGIITALFRNKRGYVLTSENSRLKSFFFMAAQIVIDMEQGELILSLTYDYRR